MVSKAMMQRMPEQPAVFVSYSRRDIEFATRLSAALIAQGFAAYLDKTDIAAGEDWKKRLGELISRADTVLFVVSPDSVASSICGWEVEEAARLGKRILPLLVRIVDDRAVPAALGRLNYVFFDRPEAFDDNLAGLVEALNTDLPWLREHTRIGEAAALWDARGKARTLVLRGARLIEAETWLARQPASSATASDMHRAFIHASRQAATRRTRFTVMGALAVAAISGVLAFWADVNRREAASQRAVAEINEQRAVAQEAEATRNAAEAERQAALARTNEVQAVEQRRRAEEATDKALRDQSRALASFAQERVGVGDALVGRALALAGLPGAGVARPLVPEALSALQRALLADRREAQLLTAGDNAYRAIITRDGRRVVGGTNTGIVFVWDIATGRRLWQRKVLEDTVSSIAEHPSEARVAIAGDKVPRVLDIETGRELLALEGHQKFTRTIVWSRDGTNLATGGADRAILWNGATGQLRHRLALPTFEDGYGRLLARRNSKTGSDIIVGAVMRSNNLLLGASTEVVFSPDGASLAVAGAADPEGAIRVYSVATGRQTHAMVGHGDTRGERYHFISQIQGLAVNAAGTLWASISSDGRETIVWDAKTGKPLRRLPYVSGPESLGFDPSGDRLAVGYEDGTFRLWDVMTGAVLVSGSGHTSAVQSIAVSPDGAQIVTGSRDGTARLWSGSVGNLLGVLRGHRDMVHAALFSPDGQKILTNSREGSVNIWQRSAPGHGIVADYPKQIGDRADEQAPLPDVLTPRQPRFHDQTGLWLVVANSGLVTYVVDPVQRAVVGRIDSSNIAPAPGDGGVLALPNAVTAKHLPPENLRMLTPSSVIGTYDFSKQSAADGRTKDWSSEVAINPQGTRVVNGLDDEGQRATLYSPKRVGLFDRVTLAKIAELRVDNRNGHNPVFSADGTVILTLLFADNHEGFKRESDHIAFWDGVNGRLLHKVNTNSGKAFIAPILSTNGRVMAARIENFPGISTVDLDATPPYRDYRLGQSFLNSHGLSPSGRRVAGGYSDGRIAIWNCDLPDAPPKILPDTGTAVTHIQISANDRILGAADALGNVRLFDLTTGVLLQQVQAEAAIGDLAISPDGRHTLAVDQRGRLHLVDLAPGWTRQPAAEDLIDWARATETETLTVADRQRYLLDAQATAPARPERVARMTIAQALPKPRPAPGPAAERCDQLARDPEDAGVPGAGVLLEKLDAAAFDACAKAVSDYPSDGPSRYHLSRVALRLGHADASGHLEAAATMKHPAALRTLSLRLRASPERQKEAFGLVQAAAGGGDPMSIRGMGRRYALGVEVEADPARAVSMLAPLVEGRRGLAADLLARVIDDGADHPAKVAKAFQYYWEALTLIPQERQADSDAARLDNARQRVRSLARQLPPERVVEAYRAALAGQ